MRLKTEREFSALVRLVFSFQRKNGLFEAMPKNPFRFCDLYESRHLADSESLSVRRPFRNEHHLDTAILLFRSFLLGSFAGAGGDAGGVDALFAEELLG